MTVTPGWYDDGSTPGVLRWWDGQTWTEHTAPQPDARAAQPAAAVVGASAGYGAPADDRAPVGHATSVGYGTPVGFGAPASTGYPVVGAQGGIGAYGQPSSATYAPGDALSDAARRAWRSALWVVLGGLAVLVIATVVLSQAADGGLVWTGGFIFGGILVVRGLAAMHRARAAGGGSVAAAWLGVLVVAGACGWVVLQSLDTMTGGSGVPDADATPGVGSCYSTLAGMLTFVPCNLQHELVGAVEVLSPEGCASIGNGEYVPLDDGTFLCLEPGF